MKFTYRYSTGYTLSELLIVITIIGIITFSIINVFSRQRVFVQYNEETIKVLSLVKLARNYASTNRSVYENAENIVPEGGYGIYIERSSTPGQSRLILFANTSTEEARALQYDAGDQIQEELVLAKEALLEDVTLTQTGPPLDDSAVERAVILFEITSAQVSIYDNGDPNDITDPPTEFDKLKIDFIRQGDTNGNSRKTFSIDRISGVPEMSL